MNAVTKAVGGLDGVVTVDVKLEENTVTVEYDAGKVSLDSIKETIEEEGYDVK